MEVAYYHPDGFTMSVPVETARKLQGLDPNMPYITDMIRDIPDAMLDPELAERVAHRVRDIPALNALFSDNHVVFCNDDSVFKLEFLKYQDRPTRYAYVYRLYNLINP